MDNNKKHTFALVDLELVKNGLSYEEAAIVHYIARFESNNKDCFASIPHIAEQLALSPRSTQRHIKKLIIEKVLFETTRGRGRFLITNGAKVASIKKLTHAKMAPYPCQNGINDPCQNGMLPIEVLPIKTTNKKNKYINNQIKPKPQPTTEQLNQAAERFGLRRRFGDASKSHQDEASDTK